ncbi:CDP-alcohol phosphatidyltransferase family protein [archaeon AH-315-M20]|nr:CDP-alcohol phosphatidyltransferase family protein [archaeon AH-315-M20]
MVEPIKKLREICYKNHKGQLIFYNQYILRGISIYITKVLLYTPITANQVTLFMLIFGITGSVFLFNGFFIIGLLLIHLAQLLDSVDGEIARYKKEKTMLGKYLDTIYHTITTPLMLFGFAYGTYNLYPNKLLIVFGFLSAIFAQSIVMPSIFDTIVSSKIRGVSPPIKKSRINEEEVLEYEGQTKEYKNLFLKIYHNLRGFWKFPSNLLMLTALYIWEVINLKYSFAPAFITSVVFFIIYGSFVTLAQIASFVFHTKKNSIDSFYVFLFGKK